MTDRLPNAHSRQRSLSLRSGAAYARQLASGPIARASGISLAIRLAGLALSFAQAVLTARLLGAGGYGTVAVVMSVVSIVATVCQFGFGALAVREVAARLAAGDGPGLRAFVRFATLATVLLSLLAALGLALGGWTQGLVPEHYRDVLALGALLVLPIALIGLFRGVAQGFGRIALAQLPGEFVRPAALVLVMGLAATLGLAFSPADYIFATAGAVALAALIGGAFLWLGEKARLSGSTGAIQRRRQTAASLPFLGLALTAMLQGEMNTLLLGWLAGPHETGLFQPIVRLTPVLTLAVQAAGMRYAPRMAEFWERGEIDRIRAVTATFTWTTTLATLPVALAIAAAGPWLMLVFGPEFEESAPLLWWVAGAQVFNAACGPVGMLLAMSGRSGSALAGQVAGLAVNGVVGIYLIPSHGAFGAVIAMALGIVVWNLTMLVRVVKMSGLNPTLVGVLMAGARS